SLLRRMREEGRSSYRRFSTPEELAQLLGDDLAVLVTERFHGASPTTSGVRPAIGGMALSAIDAQRHGELGSAWPALAAEEPRQPLDAAPIPQSVTSFVGRQLSTNQLFELMARDDVRLVTLLGPGGIGKSRLALEFSAMTRGRFADGVAFVPLDAVRDPELVASEIGIALGIRESVGANALERLIESLEDREFLLVLDNFEGLLDAVPTISTLLASAPRLKVLVTSRTVLRARGEVVYQVPPMHLPPAGKTQSPREAMAFGGVRLFVERAKSVSPDFELDDDNVEAVIDLCRRLDG